MPGVHGVFTAADIAQSSTGSVPKIPLRLSPLPELVPFEQPVIAEKKVRYVGEPIALVVADSLALAEDALDAHRGRHRAAARRGQPARLRQ